MTRSRGRELHHNDLETNGKLSVAFILGGSIMYMIDAIFNIAAVWIHYDAKEN